jgi:hypothetical protein
MPVHSIHVYSVAVKKGYVGPLNVHKIHYVLQRLVRDDIFNLLRSPEIDSKESIPPDYVAGRVATTTLFLLGS